MRNPLKNIPVLGKLARRAYRRLIPFPGSERYWIRRYASGGNSGDGSYQQLAAFKAEVINRFVREQGIRTVVEFGCGDGSQLALADYPSYLGLDVSPQAIERCEERFAGDPTKTFKLMRDYEGERAQLALSLDVIYHLVEDDVYEAYMGRLFDTAEEFVIIYSSNMEKDDRSHPPHVRHRKLTDWVDRQRPHWYLQRHIPNRYPYRGDSRTGSLADFFIYAKARSKEEANDAR